MPTTTSYWIDGELVEVSSSGEATSTISHCDELLMLRGKSKRQLADMYMRGVIDRDTFDSWCQGEDNDY